MAVIFDLYVVRFINGMMLVPATEFQFPLPLFRSTSKLFNKRFSSCNRIHKLRCATNSTDDVNFRELFVLINFA